MRLRSISQARVSEHLSFAIFADEALTREVRIAGLWKGIPVALVDGITAGLGEHLFKPIGRPLARLFAPSGARWSKAQRELPVNFLARKWPAKGPMFPPRIPFAPALPYWEKANAQ